MTSINLNHDLFNYSDKKNNDETVSLASSYISSYDSIDNNIQDLVNIINGGGKPLNKKVKPRQQSCMSCNLSTIKEVSTNDNLLQNINISPNDSVSNIGSDINNELKKITNNIFNKSTQPNNNIDNNNIDNNNIDNNNIDNSISKFASVIQHHNSTNHKISADLPKLIHTKSIFGADNYISAPPNQPPPRQTITTSIFDNNKNIQQNTYLPKTNTFIGGAEPDFKSGLLIALFVVASFCFIGVSSTCAYVNIIHTLGFVLFIGFAILFIDNRQKNK